MTEPIPELTMVRIPERARRRIKQQAVAQGIKLWEAVERAVDEWCDGKDGAK